MQAHFKMLQQSTIGHNDEDNIIPALDSRLRSLNREFRIIQNHIPTVRCLNHHFGHILRLHRKHILASHKDSVTRFVFRHNKSEIKFDTDIKRLIVNKNKSHLLSFGIEADGFEYAASGTGRRWSAQCVQRFSVRTQKRFPSISPIGAHLPVTGSIHTHSWRFTNHRCGIRSPFNTRKGLSTVNGHNPFVFGINGDYRNNRLSLKAIHDFDSGAVAQG